jgi:hypothetical protein
MEACTDFESTSGGNMMHSLEAIKQHTLHCHEHCYKVSEILDKNWFILY